MQAERQPSSVTHRLRGRSRFLALAVLGPLFAGSAAADGIAIGPLDGAEACQRFCEELVFDCRYAVFSEDSSMCLVWDQRGWESPQGLSVAAPSEADCTAVATDLGGAFWWDAATGACRQGTRDLVCEADDWAGLWETTYEDMRLEIDGDQVSGVYRLDSGANHAIRGSLLPGDACVLVGEWDHLDGNSGPFRFELTGPGSFAGAWSSSIPPTASSATNWRGTRYE